MKELTLKDLWDNYGKLDNLKARFSEVAMRCGHSELTDLPEDIKKRLPPISHEPKWEEEKDLLSIEKIVDMDTYHRYYYVSVWKEAEQKTFLGIIIFGQRPAQNQKDYMVEHMSLFFDYDNFLFKSHHRIDSLTSNCEHAMTALIKIAKEIIQDKIDPSKRKRDI